MQLFDPQHFGQLAPHQVAGFDRPIPAICYRGADLKSQYPIGAIGTGYFELRGDGKLGLSSLYNSYVPNMTLSGTLLTLLPANGQPIPLDAEHCDISILAHFPVCNLRFAVKNGPVIWLRTLTTMLPGDHEGSNTPGVIFEISCDDPKFIGDVRITLALDHNVEPRVEKRELPKGLNGAARANFHNADYRGSFVLAWIDHGDGRGEVNDANATYTLTGPLSGKPRQAVFAWHVPWWIDSGGEPHMNRYASRFKDAIDVAQFLASNHASILSRTLGWQKVVYETQPDWLANALVQSLYSYTKNTLWVDEHRSDRWYGPTGFFTHAESFRGCPIVETMVCRQHGHWAHLLLFPELEKNTLEAFAHYQLRGGEVPFSFGSPTSLRDPRFQCQHPLNSSQYVQMLHRYLARTGDEEFAKRMWDSASGAMQYAMSLDDDNDGLINEHSHALPGGNWPANQFYDQWPWFGTSSYVSSQGLAALRAFAAIADRLGERDAHANASRQIAQGVDSFRKKLWNGSYFRLWHDEKRGNNETCLANQLMGQWCCRVAGLEPLFNEQECKSVYESIEKLNAHQSKFGLINGGNFQGDDAAAGDAGANHGVMIFIGENLCASMTGMYEGYAPAESWAKTLVMTLHEYLAMPFDQFCLIRHDTAAPAFGNDYYSNLVVWTIPMAMQKVGVAEFVRPGGMIDRMIQAAGKIT